MLENHDSSSLLILISPILHSYRNSPNTPRVFQVEQRGNDRFHIVLT